MPRQCTIKNTMSAVGVGVHSGEKISLTLRPAAANVGVVFRRIDLPVPVEIPAHLDWVGDTRFCTSLIKDGIKIGTVEHLLSAVSGLGVDNLYVDLTGPEVPIMDGSAARFVFLIQCAGIEEQDASKKFMRIKRKVEVRDGDKIARLSPSDGFKVSFTIDFDHPFFHENNQTASLDFSSTAFIKEISRARTFGFMADFEYLREKKLILGGSLENAIVLDDEGMVNKECLRYRDEFVRHKILDVVGDLFLLGHPLLGAFEGYKSGHALNNKLLRAVLADADAWEMVES
jgi:UDP-3-O-[3-hydroxymyristoyl] N-acetylglucosamine deacetylase